MVEKYVMVRMPREANDGFIKKQQLIQRRIKAWTGKDVKIPMTKIYRLVAKNPSEITERNIIRLVKKKEGGKK